MKQLLRMLGLLLALALQLPAAWGNPIVAYVQSTVQTGNSSNAYRIASLVAVPDAGQTISNYTLNNVPADAQGGRLAYPANADGSGGLVVATNGVTITQAQANILYFAPASGFSGAVNNGGAFNPRSFTFTANQSNNVSTTADYTVFVAGYNTTNNLYDFVGANQTAANIPNVTTTGNAMALPALTATTNNGATLTGYRLLTLPAAAAGTLYVNGTAATANQNLTAAQAAQLTFVPSGNTYQGAPFFAYSGYSGTTAGAPGFYTLPVSTSRNVLIDPIDLSRRTSGEDWKTDGSVTANNTTLTHSGYTSAGVLTGNTNTFAIGNLAGILPGPSLVWQLNPQGSNPATAPTQSQVTLTFDRAVTNLSLTLTDIDRDIVNASFIDEFDLNAYSTDAATTPLSLTNNATVTLANAQVNRLVANTNTLQGIGTSNADANGTVVVTFSSPVKRLVLTYRNTAPYVDANTNRTHTMGITSMTWLAQADLTTTLTGPGSLSAGVQSGNYTVTYTNNGPEPAASTTRTVTIPNTYVSAVNSSAGTVSNTGGNYVITFPTGTNVPAGSTGAVTYTFTVTPTLTSAGNTIAATSTTAPGPGGTDQGANTAADQATASYVVGAIADVGASFSSGQGDNTTVVAGTAVTYGVTFTNAGPSTASDVTRTVSIPAGVPTVTLNPANSGVLSGSQAQGWTITYPGGSVPLNATGTTYSFSYVAPATGPVTITARTTTSTNQGTNTVADQATRTLNVTTIPVSGTVFDDVNYGGGAGRAYGAANPSATASGFNDGAIGRAGATVEFYNTGSGAFVGSTTTGTNGTYSYNLPATGNYTVRVVNSTVTSARTPTATGVLPVQTYVLNNANQVGGANPRLTDAAANTGSQNLSDLTPNGGTTTPQSLYSATFNTTTTNSGVDFGFNFDTVVNTNDVAAVSGTNAQGSLRQFILNSNALARTNLAQSGFYTNSQNLATGSTAAGRAGVALTTGVESSIFMIPAAQLTSGVAIITPAVALPQITGGSTSINGSTQTYNIGNTNDVLLGTGGTVGTTNTALSQLNGPEVQLTGNSAIALGLDVTAPATSIRGLAVLGFGNAQDNDGNANIRGVANNVLITQNVLGTTASSFTVPSTLTNADNVRLIGGTNAGVTVSNNLIGYSNSKGVSINNGVTNVTVSGNEIRGNGMGAPNFDGVDIQGSSATVTNNLLTGTSGQGVDSYRSAGSNIITGNTVTDNGRGTTNLNPNETPGIRIYGAGNRVSQNIISDNYGAGIMLEGTQGNSAAVSNTLLSQNSIFNNGNVRSRNNLAPIGEVGIDLQVNGDGEPAGTSPYVTLNSATTTGANGLVNYPVITNANISGNNLVVSGYAKSGATIELFTAQANPTSVNSSTTVLASNFGQGRTYLTTVTEGATTGVADTDTRTGLAYSGNINGFNQGSDTNANGFTFTIPLSSLPGGTLAAGTLLTATATLSGATSEFSGNAAATPALTGFVYEDVNYGGGAGRPRTTSGAVTRPGAKVELYDTNGNYLSTAITDANGQYTFNVNAGNYTVRVVNNSVLSSRTGATAASGSATTGYVSNQLPVQTYNGTSTRVGGENPAFTDAAANSGTQTLASLSSGTTLPESISTFTVSTTGSNAGPDFGFNFDTVVNTNDVATVSGNNAQGSLRQFILNSNALGGESSLAPVYTAASGATTSLAPGLETSIFMIPNGAAVAGQRAGLTNAAGGANFTTPNNGSGTATTIALAAALPNVTGPTTAIDGTTQTRSTGDSNQPVTTLGAESTGPEVLLNLNSFAALTFGANDDQLVNLGVYNSVNGGQGVAIASGAQRTILQGNTINNNGANISFAGTNAGTPSAATIQNNVIRDSQRGNADGIELNGNNSNMTITGNQILRNSAFGIDFIGGANTNNTITGNTFAYNGTGTGGTQLSGIGLRSSGSNGNNISQNTFRSNSGAGIVALSGTTGNIFSQNSFSGNGVNPYGQNGAYTAPTGLGLGIDLMAGNASTNGDGVTLNDNGDTDTGANGLINFPIIQSAVINADGTVTVTGFARPSTTVELYLAADDPTHFGEGQTFVTSFQQGSAAGTANGVTTGAAGTYGPGTLNDGLTQGTDNTLTYSFTFTPTAAQLTALRQSTALLTSTATLTAATTSNGNFGTSEFSGNARIFQAPVPNDVTNVNVPDNQPTAVVLNPNLSGTVYGLTANVTASTANTIVSYTISAPSAGGTLYYNNGTTNVAVTGPTTIPAGSLSGLTFLPNRGYLGNVTFTYTALDANGLASSQHNSGGTVTNGPATYTIPVVASADVTASLTGGTTLTAGQPTGYYTATFSNLGPDQANSVTQTVTLPTGATLTQAQQNALTNTYTGTTFPVVNGNQTISFQTAATLASGTSNSFRFAFTAPTAPGSSTLTASTNTNTNQGANTAPDAASLAITTGALTDLQVTLTNNNTSVVAPGGTATFVATVTNLTSNQPAAGVVPTVQLVPNLANLNLDGQTGTANAANTTLTFANGAVYTLATGLLVYPTASLAGGASASSTITFTMPASGVVPGTASATTTTAETNLANNVASANITAGPSFDLMTTLTGPTAVVAGSPVTLNVSTSNNGPQAISGAVQTVTIPSGLTASGSTQNVFVSNGGTYDSSTGTVTFPALGSLPAGQMVGNTITFTAPSAAFKPVATVTPNTTSAGETNINNNTAYLNGSAQNDATATLTPATATGTAANVYATLTASAQIVAGNTQVTFTAGIGNAGPGTASNVSARLQLIPSLSTSTLLVNNQAGTLSSDGKTIGFPNNSVYTIATGILAYANTPTLPSGLAASATATVTVPAGVGNDGQLLATMSVGSQTPDNVPADNVKAVTVAVQPQTDLATTLVGPTTGVTAGQPVGYTATFTNNGPTTALAVAETVQLPAGLMAATLTVGGQTGTANGNNTVLFASGASYNTATGLLTLPTLANDAAGAVQSYFLTFPAPAQSFVVSSAVSSATPETTLTNNAASVATAVTPTADVAVAVAGPAVAVAGNQVTYTVSVTNNGPTSATNVVPTLQLPAGLTLAASGPGATTYDANGLVTFPAIGNLQAGVTTDYYVTFTMPTPASGQLSATAAVSSGSFDNVAGNNTAGVTTSLAPATTTSVDLLTSISPASGTLTANTTASYTLAYRNAGTATATGVAATALLPTGLGTSLLVGNVAGTFSANTGLYNFTSGPAAGATYDPATGLLTFPISTLAPSANANSYTVAFPAPTSGQLVVVSAINSPTTESVTNNNRQNSSITITPTADLAATITGPVAALAGVPSVYTATFSNVGLSPTSNVVPTVQLPNTLGATTLLVAGQTGTVSGSNINYPNGASYSTTSGLLTFAQVASLAPGTNNALSNSFTVTMPSGGLTATASYSAASIPASDTNTANNSQSITTTNSPLSLAPTADNIVNSLQSARGNTSNTNLLLTPLSAADPDGTIANYYVQNISALKGTLYYSGTAISSIPAGGYQVANPALLSYKPAAGFVGNDFFTYSATDNSGVVSNLALYTIPVAQDLSTTYNTYNTGKGGSNPYMTGDVLATTQDPNTDIFNNAGLIYNATTGALQTGAVNGVGSASYTGTLPNGVSFATTATSIVVNGTTIQIPAGMVYVSNAALLPRVTTTTNYPITVTTTDLNGGVNTVPVTITLGAYPLPVELVVFTAQAVQNRDGLLKWTTASELNNDHFEVERSLDGTSFTKLGQVAGQGSKATATDYAFTDAGIGPKVAAGQPVYYRLKQVDLNGTTSYSPVRAVNFTASTTATVTLYPNPATTATSLDLSALPATGTYQVLLLDATGRQVRQATLSGGLLQSLDLHELSSGTYSVLVTGQRADGSTLRQVLRLIKE